MLICVIWLVGFLFNIFVDAYLSLRSHWEACVQKASYTYSSYVQCNTQFYETVVIYFIAIHHEIPTFFVGCLYSLNFNSYFFAAREDRQSPTGSAALHSRPEKSQLHSLESPSCSRSFFWFKFYQKYVIIASLCFPSHVMVVT